MLGLFHGCDGQNSAGFLKFSRWKCRLRKEGRRKGTEGKKERGERGFWLVLLLEILPPPLLLPPPPPLVAPLARCFQFRTRLEFRFLWSTTLCTPLLPVLFNPALGFGQALQLRAFFLFSISSFAYRETSRRPFRSRWPFGCDPSTSLLWACHDNAGWLAGWLASS